MIARNENSNPSFFSIFLSIFVVTAAPLKIVHAQNMAVPVATMTSTNATSQSPAAQTNTTLATTFSYLGQLLSGTPYYQEFDCSTTLPAPEHRCTITYDSDSYSTEVCHSVDYAIESDVVMKRVQNIGITWHKRKVDITSDARYSSSASVTAKCEVHLGGTVVEDWYIADRFITYSNTAQNTCSFVPHATLFKDDDTNERWTYVGTRSATYAAEANAGQITKVLTNSDGAGLKIKSNNHTENLTENYGSSQDSVWKTESNLSLGDSYRISNIKFDKFKQDPATPYGQNGNRVDIESGSAANSLPFTINGVTTPADFHCRYQNVSQPSLNHYAPDCYSNPDIYAIALNIQALTRIGDQSIISGMDQNTAVATPVPPGTPLIPQRYFDRECITNGKYLEDAVKSRFPTR